MSGALLGAAFGLALAMGCGRVQTGVGALAGGGTLFADAAEADVAVGGAVDVSTAGATTARTSLVGPWVMCRRARSPVATTAVATATPPRLRRMRLDHPKDLLEGCRARGCRDDDCGGSGTTCGRSEDAVDLDGCARTAMTALQSFGRSARLRASIFMIIDARSRGTSGRCSSIGVICPIATCLKI